MDERWLQSHLGTETEIRPEFEDRLAERLTSEWRGASNVWVEARAAQPAMRPHRMRLLLAVAAVAAIVAAGIAITRSGPTLKPAVNTPSDPVSNSTVPDTDTIVAPVTVAPPATTEAVPTQQSIPEDRLAAWPTPPADLIGIDAIPLLLPTAPIAGTSVPVRASVDGGSAAPPTFTQVFADAEHDILLTLQTQPSGADSTPAALRQPITISGWDDAFLTTGGLRLVASGPSGFVRLTGTGIDADQAASIIATLERRPNDAPGWDLSADFGLTEINGAWNDSAATRTVTWFAGDRVVAQMFTSPGQTDQIAQALGSSFDRVDVNGAAGWFNPTDPRRAIVWSPDGTTIVVLAITDASIDPLEIARSVAALDDAGYVVVTTTEIPPGIGDGCDASLFC